MKIIDISGITFEEKQILKDKEAIDTVKNLGERLSELIKMLGR